MRFKARARGAPVILEDLVLGSRNRRYHERDRGRKLCVALTHRRMEQERKYEPLVTNTRLCIGCVFAKLCSGIGLSLAAEMDKLTFGYVIAFQHRECWLQAIRHGSFLHAETGSAEAIGDVPSIITYVVGLTKKASTVRGRYYARVFERHFAPNSDLDDRQSGSPFGHGLVFPDVSVEHLPLVERLAANWA